MNEPCAIDVDSCLTVKAHMVLREESDECALLFDPDLGRVHVLNPTAVAVWKLLDGRRTLGEITATLAEQFADMGPEAAGQIVALARSLAELGAVGPAGR